jgi:hypothetical protein
MVKTPSKVAVVVLSHDDDLLEKFRGKPGVTSLNLNNLELPPPLDSNNLAEFRFFISKISAPFVDCDSVTVLSARYEERFPWLPGIEKIVASGDFLPTDHFYAPLTFRLSGKAQFDKWVDAQDEVHPGMTSILRDFLSDHDYEVNRHPYIVMGGNVVLSGQDFENLRNFMCLAVSWVFQDVDSNLNFTFRCPICGHASGQFVGRWDDSRKMGFLLERMMAIWFVTNASNLTLKDFPSSPPPLPMRVTSLLPVHLLINRFHLSILRLSKLITRNSCEH